ncbi:MAG: hypothetical protein Q9159_002788 [Coniocarpon cinnabarinum]
MTDESPIPISSSHEMPDEQDGHARDESSFPTEEVLEQLLAHDCNSGCARAWQENQKETQKLLFELEKLKEMMHRVSPDDAVEEIIDSYEQVYAMTSKMFTVFRNQVQMLHLRLQACDERDEQLEKERTELRKTSSTISSVIQYVQATDMDQNLTQNRLETMLTHVVDRLEPLLEKEVTARLDKMKVNVDEPTPKAPLDPMKGRVEALEAEVRDLQRQLREAHASTDVNTVIESERPPTPIA